ncbi:hypothetical protein APHAL10511_008639 [Amanita phalloides]|nr:hypothetical protein APHAL10511_008639 [Amanita phalloides]
MAATTLHAPTPGSMNVQGVETPPMELKAVLAQRVPTPLTPYKANAWVQALKDVGLQGQYPDIAQGLTEGFKVGAPSIQATFCPPNHESTLQFVELFNRSLHHELSVGRYIGPFTHNALEGIIGPFQSSPLSIMPKPAKPGKYRIIQNFSFLYTPHNTSILSINAQVNPDKFPCTWGTFNTICDIIFHLPPGSQAAMQDVSEAYCTVPLHPSAWPATVICLPRDTFGVDSNLGFGYAPAAGVYRHLADAGADIMHLHGIGPISKWVDNHIFFWILTMVPRSTKEATFGIEGGDTPDGSYEEFDNDHRFPLHDLVPTLLRSMEDIDLISAELGITWEKSKYIPFTSIPTFLGFNWDLETCRVLLPAQKHEKYLTAIDKWEAKYKHTLEEVQSLHGKLLHMSHILPKG